MIEFFQHLNSLHPLSPEATSGLLKVIRAKELRRGQVWLQEGAVCDKLTFVVKGLLKLYFETGTKELIVQFAIENEFILSAHSYLSRKPSAYSIRSIEQTVVVYLLSSDWDHLLAKHPELISHYLMTASKQVKKMEEHLSLLLLPPKDRFEKLLDNGSWLIDGRRVTDKLLAAYLGVRATTVCEWRKGKRL